MLIVLLVYLFVIAVGALVYLALPSALGIVYRVLIADLVATLLIWVISLFVNNASLYDPYWSVIPPVIIFLLLFENQKWSLSLVLFVISLSIWAIRLTYNWGKLWTDFSHVDWRYKRFQDMAPKLYWLVSFLAIMLFPTLIVFAQLIGPILLTVEPIVSFGPFSIIGGSVIIIAAFIQLVADTQMQNYKKNPANRGAIMREGFWKYSRHPNYLGEVMVWWGVYLFYVQQFGFDGMIVAPILMTMMFIFVSVPLMEKKILKTRPQYREYIKEAGMLIPFNKQIFAKKPVELEK